MLKPNRSRVLDESKKETILALLSVGCSRETAARYVGCDPKRVENVIERDPAFAEKVARAEMAVEVAHLRNVLQAARDRRNWRAAAWFLERAFPEKYGAKRGRRGRDCKLATANCKLNKRYDVGSVVGPR